MFSEEKNREIVNTELVSTQLTTYFKYGISVIFYKRSNVKTYPRGRQPEF